MSVLFMRRGYGLLAEPCYPEALANLAQGAGNARMKVDRIPEVSHDCMENMRRC